MKNATCPQCNRMLGPGNDQTSGPQTSNQVARCETCGARVPPKTRLAVHAADPTRQSLGGYRILRVIGRGAMGMVYEAKQVSLDRVVALKTIRDRWVGNPSTLARFTREAYAAAQLRHHNVVQIYDFGNHNGQYYFSMERVRGGSLSELVRKKGVLPPKLAAGYVLQAARGLAVAHRRGMVHRDVKPANLLLDENGIIKVADLGLVKIPDLPDPQSDVGAASGIFESGTNVTMQGTAVGTPAYMAPEQSSNAANVDHRADIYSLGCTLFYLLTGKPPFDADEASAVIEQHAAAPFPNPGNVNSRVPLPLSEIIRRATAKIPHDRYALLDQMGDELESFLGIKHDGHFVPSSAQVDQIEKIALAYSRASGPEKWVGAILAANVLLSIVALTIPWIAGWSWLLLGPGFLVATVATAIVMGGTQNQINLHWRRWFISIGWFEHVTVLVCLVALATAIGFLGLGTGALVGIVAGVGAAAIYHVSLVTTTEQAVADSCSAARDLVRKLRIEGADEAGIRYFVASHGGRSWQRFFERVFGYSAMVAMRRKLRHDATFDRDLSDHSLRDRICEMLDRRTRRNRLRRDHSQLAQVEQRGLVSQGVQISAAKQQAWNVAAAVIESAQPSDYQLQAEATTPAMARRQRMRAMLAEARSGKYRSQPDRWASVRAALGSRTRLVIGATLITVFVIWGDRHGLFETFKDASTYQEIAQGRIDLTSVKDTASRVTNRVAKTDLFGHGTNAWSIGIGGLCMAMSAFVSGWRMTPFAILATGVILFGPMLGIPAIPLPENSLLPIEGLLKPWIVSALAGIAIYISGIMIGGETD